MESFNELQNCIRTAVKNDYDFLVSPRISLLELSENMTCLLTDGNNKYILQVNRLGYRTDTQLEGEFAWLRELNEEPGLKTARVYSGNNGSARQTFVSTHGTRYNYSLQEFLPGKKLRDLDGSLIIKQIALVGETAAKLHLQSIRRAENSPSLDTLRWDIDDIVSPTARWGYYKDYPGLTAEQCSVLEKTETVIRTELGKYGKKADRYGLIHADIHANNILINDGEPAVIDFDDCGYGWYLYDLGSAVSKFSYGLHEMLQSLVEGYEKYRRLTEADKQIIPTMVMLRRLARLGWLASHSENGVLEKEGDDYLMRTCRIADDYMRFASETLNVRA